jgi:hypothetical protein
VIPPEKSKDQSPLPDSLHERAFAAAAIDASAEND